MTIIKKRGRIVRNIFVIDRYDAPHRAPTGCWEEMLSRMYSVDPNAPRRRAAGRRGTPYVGYLQRSFSDPKVEKSKWKDTIYRVRNASNPISKGRSFTKS
jgi:hypothetical protein